MVAVEPLDGIFNTILFEGDQVCGHLGGNWEVELGSPHQDMEGFKIKPFLRGTGYSKCSHLPVVNSLKEGGKVVTDIL